MERDRNRYPMKARPHGGHLRKQPTARHTAHHHHRLQPTSPRSHRPRNQHRQCQPHRHCHHRKHQPHHHRNQWHQSWIRVIPFRGTIRVTNQGESPARILPPYGFPVHGTAWARRTGPPGHSCARGRAHASCTSPRGARPPRLISAHTAKGMRSIWWLVFLRRQACDPT